MFFTLMVATFTVALGGSAAAVKLFDKSMYLLVFAFALVAYVSAKGFELKRDASTKQ